MYNIGMCRHQLRVRICLFCICIAFNVVAGDFATINISNVGSVSFTVGDTVVRPGSSYRVYVGANTSGVLDVSVEDGCRLLNNPFTYPALESGALYGISIEAKHDSPFQNPEPSLVNTQSPAQDAEATNVFENNLIPAKKESLNAGVLQVDIDSPERLEQKSPELSAENQSAYKGESKYITKPSISIFGVQLGSSVKSTDSKFNDNGFIEESFEPEQRFTGFTIYEKFASPENFKVFSVRGFCRSASNRDFEVAVSAIEKKFGITMGPKKSSLKLKGALTFENSRLGADLDGEVATHIGAIKNGIRYEVLTGYNAMSEYCVEIKVTDIQSEEAAKKYISKRDEEKFSSEVQVIKAIASNMKSGSPLTIAGITFGNFLKEGKVETNNVGSLVMSCPYMGKMFGSSEYLLFASPITKKVYRIRFIIDASDNTCAAMRRIISRVMENDFSHDNFILNSDYTMYLDDYEIQITSPIFGSKMLDIVDKKLRRNATKEAEEAKESMKEMEIKGNIDAL